MINRIIFIALLALCNICAAQTDSSSIDITALYSCWTDSREENIKGTGISNYRPCDYKDFPAIRFRHRIEFKETGECSALMLSPSDAHYTITAKWNYDKEQKILTMQDETGKLIFKARLLVLSKDLMKFEKVK